MRRELTNVHWLSKAAVYAEAAVAMGLLLFLTAYTYFLDMAAAAVTAAWALFN